MKHGYTHILKCTVTEKGLKYSIKSIATQPPYRTFLTIVTNLNLNVLFVLIIAIDIHNYYFEGSFNFYSEISLVLPKSRSKTYDRRSFF